MPEHYDFRPEIVLPLTGFGQSAPITFIENRLPEKVDLWLDVNAGFYLSGKPKNGIRATFLTDPHVLRSYYDGIKHYYDYVFCSQTPYAKAEEIYLPYACDSEWHKPEELEKIYDVALVGNFYPHRVELVNRLKSMGYNVFFDIGYGKADLGKIYNQSRVGLNWSTLDDLNARVFELMGIGIPSVMNRVSDLPGLFQDGEHYMEFNTPEQAIEKIKYLLENPEQAAIIGKNARNEVINSKHTWDDRAETILNVCGLTK
jgi:spore maturation protein CgeB